MQWRFPVHKKRYLLMATFLVIRDRPNLLLLVWVTVVRIPNGRLCKNKLQRRETTTKSVEES
jgi:hypothetical protein